MILLTGATGCTGSYLAKALLEQTAEPLVFWVRKAQGLPQIWREHPRIQIWEGGLEALENYRSALQKVKILIHPATVWGGPDCHLINHRQQQRLIMALSESCQQIHLFSSASILNQNHQLWPQSLLWGTDYIRSKAAFQNWLTQYPLPQTLHLYYPTVILGGDHFHPSTPVSAALPHLKTWIQCMRHLDFDGSLHLIHARDIANIVTYRLINQIESGHIVLGNEALSLNELRDILLKLYALKQGAAIPIKALLPLMVPILKPWMSEWDRFSLRQRHLRYKSHSAKDYGLNTNLTDAYSLLHHTLKAQTHRLSDAF